MNEKQIDTITLRALVRSAYDFQKLRIMNGNRVTRNFKEKLGQESNGMSEEELDKESQNILDRLRQSYNRITDGIAIEGEETLIHAKLPSEKKFKADDLITQYSELLLVDSYLRMLKDETAIFRDMEKILKKIPIWDQWLKDIAGVGPAMGAVIISEIDIHKSRYSSSLHRLAGIDVVRVGYFTLDSGKEVIVPPDVLDAKYAQLDDEGIENPKLYIEHTDGKDYLINIRYEGRSKKEYCLVNRTYISKDKEEKVRRSITFNPFLKTKLMGVLASSFIKAGGSTTVNGEKMGKAKRLELAKSKGFVTKNVQAEELDYKVAEFLRALGFEVNVQRSKYNAVYYEYKERLANSPQHASKSNLHRHNMALRYMVKIFLMDLYMVWRELEGLEVFPPYHEAKLGIFHKGEPNHPERGYS